MNNKAVIFDTNAYRSLLYDNNRRLRDTEEVKALFKHIREKESERQIRSYSNPFVLLELLAHLASRADTSYLACKRGIVGVVEHCTSDDRFYVVENSESNVCMILFGKSPEDATLTTKVLMETSCLLYADDSDNQVTLLNGRFIDIADEVDKAEKLFVDDIREYVVKAVGNAKADWELFKDDKSSRNKFLRYIRSDAFFSDWAMAQVYKSAIALRVTEMSASELKTLTERVKGMFKAPFAIYREILERLAVSGYNLLKDKRENSVWDIQIMFSCATNAGLNGQQPVLVTSDRMMLEAAKTAGQTDICLSVDAYLNEISAAT